MFTEDPYLYFKAYFHKNALMICTCHLRMDLNVSFVKFIRRWFNVWRVIPRYVAKRSRSHTDRKRTPKESQKNNKIANAGSVYLSLFMDGSVRYKLPFTSQSTGLSRIQHLNMNIEKMNFEHPWVCSYGGYQGIFNANRCHSLTSDVWPPNKRKLVP